MTLNLMKLAVGAETADDLAAWQSRLKAREGRISHVTRMWPKREAELLDGGSLFWIVARRFCVRQPLLGFERVEVDGVPKCRILLDDDLVPVRGLAKRPFQGWRYLEGKKAPPDLGTKGARSEAELTRVLAELGLL